MVDGLSGTEHAEFELVELPSLTEAQRVELEAGEEDPFDAAANTLQWRSKDRHIALRRADGRFVASAGFVLGDLQVDDGERIHFVGLGGVFVTAVYRGHGFGRRIVNEALVRAASFGPEVVLLFCHRNRAGLYQLHGFAELESPVFVQQPNGYAEIPMVAMWRGLQDGVVLPPGRVTVHSLPF